MADVESNRIGQETSPVTARRGGLGPATHQNNPARLWKYLTSSVKDGCDPDLLLEIELLTLSLATGIQGQIVNATKGTLLGH
jgi:hypothetical protein